MAGWTGGRRAPGGLSGCARRRVERAIASVGTVPFLDSGACCVQRGACRCVVLARWQQVPRGGAGTPLGNWAGRRLMRRDTVLQGHCAMSPGQPCGWAGAPQEVCGRQVGRRAAHAPGQPQQLPSRRPRAGAAGAAGGAERRAPSAGASSRSWRSRPQLQELAPRGAPAGLPSATVQGAPGCSWLRELQPAAGRQQLPAPAGDARASRVVADRGGIKRCWFEWNGLQVGRRAGGRMHVPAGAGQAG
jgi:hypothetical protein